MLDYFKYFMAVNKLSFKMYTFYRLNFLLDIIADLSGIIISILFYTVIYSYIENIGGWTIDKLYMLVLTVKLVTDIYAIFFANNVSSISKKIWSGGLDYILIKPQPLFLLLTVKNINFKSIISFISTIIMIGYVAGIYDMQFNIINILFYIITIIFAAIIKFLFSFMLSLLSFYFIKIEAFKSFFQAFFSLSSFPAQIFKHKIIKNIFTFIIPVIIIGNLPLNILTGNENYLTIFGVIITTIIIFSMLIFLLFKKIIRNYSSTG